ncbi:MAG: CBS domain-containing protein [Methanomicrobiales archaeon]|nr:CBS domain-containing protein [Methanomicrobiales archaeon]NYT20412.1 CBS domain-containing protein [Methanomicrobiales archaeon]
MKTASDFLVDVPLLHYDDPVTRARKIMREDIFRELYVHDGQRKLLGYIDITDVLRVTATKSNVTIQGYIKEITPVSPDDPVQDVLVAIRENATDSVPVVDGQNTILGGVLLSELFPVVITTQKLRGCVGDCMSTDVITCTTDDTAQKIHNLMTESGFTAFPVVKKRRLVGMISRRDLLKDGRWRTATESSIPIEGIMTTPVMTVSPDDSAGDAAALMVKHDISRLPVVDGDRIVGIIDRHDILKVLG